MLSKEYKNLINWMSIKDRKEHLKIMKLILWNKDKKINEETKEKIDYILSLKK